MMPLDDRRIRVSNEQLRLNRVAALKAALSMHASIRGDLGLERGEDRKDTFTQDELEIRQTAETFAAWLNGTARIRIVPGPIINQDSGQQRSPLPFTGANVSQIHDNENTSFTVKTEDGKGFETADAITWALTPDDGTVLTWSPSADGRTINVSAVAPGSVAGTVTDTQAFGPDGVTPLSATFTIDVLVGGTATITVEQGAVTVQ